MRKQIIHRLIGLIFAIIIVALMNINVSSNLTSDNPFNQISKSGFSFELFSNSNSLYVADCVCAERINWFGACRGETTRLCKGKTNCKNCGTVELE